MGIFVKKPPAQPKPTPFSGNIFNCKHRYPVFDDAHDPIAYLFKLDQWSQLTDQTFPSLCELEMWIMTIYVIGELLILNHLMEINEFLNG
jgi:hypothetical protein